jgi:hypothetical protein
LPSASEIGSLADEIYEALDGWNDEARAIHALAGHEAGVRAQIKAEFQRRHGTTLDAYLRDQLSGDWLVKAFALLDAPHLNDPHTRLALALIPLGTRDDELLRILEGLDHAHRQEVASRYNRAFAMIGQGSLEADLKDDLSGWELHKCLAMMSRDLTKADHLYFLSVAITGTHTDSVVDLIQQTWAQGPLEFHQMNLDWERYVRQGDGWSGGWTGMTLRQAMDDELSGEAWALVKAVLDGYERMMVGARAAPTDRSPAAAQEAQEEIELMVAEDTLTAASAGVGTNEAQVYAAVARIREIWLHRIERAPEPLKAQLQRQWEERRAQFVGVVADEMDTGGAEYQRARLLLSGALTPADEVWLASKELDEDGVVRALIKHWGSGGMNALLSAAAHPRIEGEIELRPAFDVLLTVRVTSGTPFRRVAAISRRDFDDATRGARLLEVEIDEGDSDSELRRAYQILSAADAGLRQQVVRRFAEARLANVNGESPTRKFLAYISQRYQNSTAVWDITDLLDPATRGQQLVERARGRLEASRSGILDFKLEEWIQEYDAITGEDTVELAQESLERLEWIAEQATPSQLAALSALTGQRADQLARLEYGEFRQRLQELAALKQAIAEAVATTAELALSAVLTAATGGAASGLLLASLSSAVAGMVVREAFLGQQYDLISRENAGRLAAVLAGASLGALGGELFQSAIGADRMQQLTRMQTFMQDATQETLSQVGSGIATQAFSDRAPSAEDIAAGALTMLGSVAGAGTRGALRWTPNQAAVRVRRMFLSNLAQAGVAQASEQVSQLARAGAGDVTGPQIAGTFLRSAVSALQQSLYTTAGDVGAESVQAAREAPIQATEGTPPRRPSETGADVDEAPPEGPEARTTAGTTRAGEPVSQHASDVNAAERARAVELIGERAGALRPTARRPEGPPPPGGDYGARTTSADRAVAVYDEAVSAVGGHREVGLFYNANSGEFSVRIGTENQVRGPVGEGWVAVIHLHPNPENIIVQRLPAPADVMGAALAAFRTGRHVEYVESTRPDGSTRVSRVEVTTNPPRILVEMAAEPGESARRIEVRDPDEYAREYGAETRYLDPSSRLYQWVLNDLEEYYEARRAERPYADAEGRTAMGTASGPPQGAGAERTAAATLEDVVARRAELANPPSQRPAATTGQDWADYVFYAEGRLAAIEEALREGKPPPEAPRTFRSFVAEYPPGHPVRNRVQGSRFERRTREEAEEGLGAERAALLLSQPNLSEVLNPTVAEGELTRPDSLIPDAGGTWTAVTNKSRLSMESMSRSAVEHQVIFDLTEAWFKYTGKKYVRRTGERVEVTRVWLLYDAAGVPEHLRPVVRKAVADYQRLHQELTFEVGIF